MLHASYVCECVDNSRTTFLYCKIDKEKDKMFPVLILNVYLKVVMLVIEYEKSFMRSPCQYNIRECTNIT